jgi:hypothetical protein
MQTELRPETEGALLLDQNQSVAVSVIVQLGDSESAAAVIPAPIAYIKVVAVKKLVVESVSRAAGSSFAVSTGVPRDVLPVGLAREGGPTQSRRGALH